MYYTYMLRCSDNSIYTGITTDVQRRFDEHAGRLPGKCARYTGSRQAVKIEAVWASESRETASRLEYYIKKLPKAKKEELIAVPESFAKNLGSKLDISAYELVNCSCI